MSILPTWPIAAGTAALAFTLGWSVNGWRLHSQMEKDRSARAEVTIKAIGARITENTQEEAKQHAINQKIEATKNEELVPVVRRIVDAPRLRIGAAICPAAARTPEAKSPSRSDGADTGSRLVSEDINRDIRALEIRVETALATGRACQQFVKDNGLAP